MVSGKEYYIENTKNKTVEDWIEDNLVRQIHGKKIKIIFYKYDKDSKLSINVSNIESIEEI